MNKELIVQKLIQSQLDYIARYGCGLWLHTVLERGFMGFGNMSEEQLLQEIQMRGLKDEIDNLTWPVTGIDDEPEPEDDDVRRLLLEYVTDDMRSG